MNILKVENFNKYFQKVFLLLVLLSLSLIPWIEFINTNLNELDFIFNDNLIILIILYFFIVVLFYLILNKFTSLKKYSLISFIAISIWILFQHNFLKSNINDFLQNLRIFNEYSSEIALVVVIFLVYLFFTLIKKNKFYTNFFLFFLAFNLLFTLIQFTK